MTAITCPKCSMTSHNPNDVREGYCANCHEWILAGIEKRFVAGSWSAQDLHWLYSQAKAAAKMQEAINDWHEYWDDRYDGEPLKDYEVKMLAMKEKTT